MSTRSQNFRRLTSFFAGQFSLLCVGAAAAVGSVALFVTHETRTFGTWSSSHYAADERALAARKVVKLPPLEDALPMSRIVHTADDDFSSSLRSGRVFRRSKKSYNKSKYIRTVKRSNLLGNGASDLFIDPFGTVTSRPRIRRAPQSGLYRTMCVRSCDGYMWPVSFSTTKRNFRVDEKICRNSCAAPTRLYYYENPGQEPVDMVDLRGRSYNVLPTAWRYQQQHVSSCKCRPDPWEPQALARHMKYAKLQKQGRLKSYLRKASRNARRLSRRASIGSIVLNSSFSTVETATVNGELPKVTRLKKSSNRKARRKSARAFGETRGFSSKSYKKKWSSGAKTYSSRSRSSRKAFRRAFQTDR